jgi:phospholipid-binding lipoprotein MlaA
MKRQATAVGFLVLVTVFSTGCSTAPSKLSGQPPDEPYYQHGRMMIDDSESPLQVWDPWEGMNRAVFRFNSYADRFFLNPAVSVYKFVFPGFVRQGVSNFFVNFKNIQTFINQVLQLHPIPAAQTTGRFVVNTTLGVFGLFDVATPMGIPQHQEDFGQTLGRYGVGDGPYLVLPLFGPSFVRDAAGMVVDWQIESALDPLQLDGRPKRTALYYTLLVLNTRATTSFQYYQTGSPFEYELVRLLWHTKRQLDLEKE